MLFILWLVSILESGKIKFVKNPLNLSILIFLAICLISTLISKYKYASIEELRRLLSYGLIYFMVLNFIREKKIIQTVIYSLLIVGLITAIYGILEYHNIELIRWKAIELEEPKQMSTFGHPNFFASWLIAVLPISICLLLRRKAFGVFSVIILIYALYTTHSVGAWIGFVGSFIILIIGYYQKLDKKILISLGTIVLILFIIAVIRFPQVQEKVSPPVIRRVIYKSTFNMFKANPILGTGLGTFQIYFPQYRPTNYLELGLSHFTSHAHCEYIEIAGELGIFGILAFLWIIFSFFKWWWKGTREDKVLIIGAGIGCFALLIHNLISVSLRWTSIGFIFWFMLGLCSSILGKKEYNKKIYIPKWRYLIYLPLLLGAFIVARPIVKTFQSDVQLKKAFYKAHKCEDLLDDARLKQKPPPFKKVEPLLKECIFYLEKCIKLNPYNVDARNKLAYIYMITNNLNLAVKEYKKVEKLSPGFDQIYLYLGLIFYKKGNPQKATFYLEKAMKRGEVDLGKRKYIQKLLTNLK